MLKFASAEWLGMARHWFPWAVLALLLAILVLQVNGKLNELAYLELAVEDALAAPDDEPPTPFEQFASQGDRWQLDSLRQSLRYPAFIGAVARLSTGVGWFLVILFTAVMAGEDFSRRTLHSILTRGVGRTSFLLTRCLTLWLATGVGVAAVAVLAAAGGLYVHTRVTDLPASLEGLGEALLFVLRAWLTCLPFVAATLFWVVLARQAGPALGVGLGIHFIELFAGMFVPYLEASCLLSGGPVPSIVRWPANVLGVMLGYNADVVLHWGPPGVTTQGFLNAMIEAGAGELILATDPWRAALLLTGYTLLPLALAARVLHRRDVAYSA
jgi:ABC-type transport system involved in multi-copper enzyme maturation permease subunit